MWMEAGLPVVFAGEEAGIHSWDLLRLSEGGEGPATLGFLPGNDMEA